MKTKTKAALAEIVGTVTRTIEVELDEAGKIRAGVELGRTLKELADHQAHARVVKERLRSEEKRLQAVVGAQGARVRSGKIDQEVTVTVERHDATGEIVERLEDGRELVRRPMEAGERQGNLLAQILAGQSEVSDEDEQNHNGGGDTAKRKDAPDGDDDEAAF